MTTPTAKQVAASRTWSQADRVARVIPISALRWHGSEAAAMVATGCRLTVLKHGRPVAILVPIFGEQPAEAAK